MEETFSQNFKRIFLLTFTKELIAHSAKRDIIKLQSIIESKELERKEKPLGWPIRTFTKKIKEIKIPAQEIFERSIEIPPIKKPVEIQIKPRPFAKFAKPLLFIPEPKLPPHLEYLKPTATTEVEIDLLKLNPLIKDSAVKIIEADPDERVIVGGTMGTKPTDIILNKEDIDKVINKFSETSKIPVNEGIYRVVVGNLILSAIISETIGSKFIIKKMTVNQNTVESQQPRYPMLPFQNNNLR